MRAYNAIMLEAGPWQIESVVTGHFRLDGGAMFGVVPKVLWQNVAAPDELNRIALATRTLLAIHRPAGRIALVDTGLGTKWKTEAAARFAIEPIADALPQALARHGATPEDVTDVVVTHLHFDHAGGMTRWLAAPDGPTALCFPNAQHWVQAAHWAHAHAPTVRDRASFLAADYAALEQSPRLRLVDAPRDALPGVEWFVANGHTPAQLLPIFGGGDGPGVVFAGDVVPTAAHLPVAWVMAYDLLPLASVAERENIYARCRTQDLRLAFPHDPHCGAVRLDLSTGRPEIAERFP
jgi:glyoxylase-like metal-dependent hydrolase (beta-lactamase superfamily II)